MKPVKAEERFIYGYIIVAKTFYGRLNNKCCSSWGLQGLTLLL